MVDSMELAAALAGSTDDGTPSLFELLSEQELKGLLPPTIRYLLTAATQRYPRYLLRVLNSFDELYALAALVIEHYYLRTRGGSFTEHFYGLKRERAPATELLRASTYAPDAVADALRLRWSDVWRNLAVSVAVPYIKRKLDEAHDTEGRRALLGPAYTRLPDCPTVQQRILHCWRWLVRIVYPSAHATCHGAVLAFHLAYLFGGPRCHHPLLWLIGTRIRRRTPTDSRAIDERIGGAGTNRRGLCAPRNVVARMLGGLSLALPASIFALKLLEWWHQSDFAKQLSRRASEAVDLPPPIVSGLPDPGSACKAAQAAQPSDGPAKRPARADVGEDEKWGKKAPVATPSLLPILTVAPPADSALCPICGDAMASATACQTGFVYCYACIHRWLAGEHPIQQAFMAGRQGRWESGMGRCAVTGRRVLGGPEGLRRIMM